MRRIRIPDDFRIGYRFAKKLGLGMLRIDSGAAGGQNAEMKGDLAR